MSRRAAIAAVLLAAALSGRAATAGTGPTVYAIGDIHGALDPLDQILVSAGLAETPGRWSGGEAVLVQTGDFTDRGAQVREVIDRLRELESQAHAAGGRVEVLLGNHELMNLTRDYRDVGVEMLARFAGTDSERRRRDAYKEWRRFWRRRTVELGFGLPESIDRKRSEWEAEHPAGWLEYQEALGPEGAIGAWLRQRAVATTVGDTLFLHGGLSPEVVDQPLAEVNAAVQGEVARFDRYVERLVELGAILPFFDRLEIIYAVDFALTAARAGGQPESPESRELGAILADLTSTSLEWMSFRANGPLWYRGYAQLDEPELARLLEATFEHQGVGRVVAGHTPSASASIVSRLDGKLYLIDTGMQPLVNPRGRPAALEIGARGTTAIYAEGRQALHPEAPRDSEVEAGGGYLLIQAPAAPTPAEPPVPEERRFLGPDGPLPFSSADEIVSFLRTARVTETKDIGQGVTHPVRLTLERHGVVARAVFHDVNERQRAKHLPGKGIISDFRDSYRCQVAGYRVARLLDFDRVPPAALREHEGVEGSAALWIENAMDERQRLERGLTPPDPLAWQREFYDMRVFDNLIHNIDRNQTNIMIDDRWRIWLIDTTRAFGTGTDLPYEKSLLRCSRKLWRAIRSLDIERAKTELNGLLSGPEIKALMKRRDKVVAHLEERIARLGEDRVLFRRSAPADEGQVDDTDPTTVPPG